MDIEELKKKFGEQVKSHRSRLKLTQEQFAEQIEIEQPSLSNIEKGKSYPAFETICSLIEKGGIEPAYLFSFLSCSEKLNKIDIEASEMFISLPEDAKPHISAVLKMILKKQT